jgi:hypothetical protein
VIKARTVEVHEDCTIIGGNALPVSGLTCSVPNTITNMLYIGDVPIVERNYGMIITLLIFTSLSCLAVWLRIYTRMFLVRNTGPDDVFIFLAMVSSYSFSLVYYRGVTPVCIYR